MGLCSKIKAGLHKTAAKLGHELKRIVTGSPKLTGKTLEELEHALLAADLGMAMTTQSGDWGIAARLGTQARSPILSYLALTR